MWHVVSNAEMYTYFDDVTLVGPFLHLHHHILHVAKPLYRSDVKDFKQISNYVIN